MGITSRENPVHSNPTCVCLCGRVVVDRFICRCAHRQCHAMAFWHDRHATAPSPSALHLTLLCLLIVFLRLTSALQYVAGSPCESVCADAGTLNEDVVCLDADYQALPQGRAYQKCVACQLNSTAVDTSKNETDVGWGLCMLPTLSYLLRTHATIWGQSKC